MDSHERHACRIQSTPELSSAGKGPGGGGDYLVIAFNLLETNFGWKFC